MNTTTKEAKGCDGKLVDRAAILATVPPSALTVLAAGGVAVGKVLQNLAAKAAEHTPKDEQGGIEGGAIIPGVTSGELMTALTMAALGYAMMSGVGHVHSTAASRSGIPDDFDTINSLPI